MATILGTTPVAIFHSGKDGYGFAVAEEGKEGYHWTMNWDCRPLNRAVPSAAPASFGRSTFTSFYSSTSPATLFEWFDSNGVPFLVAPGGAGPTDRRLVTFGDLTGSGSGTSINGPAVQSYNMSGVLYRYAQAGPDPDAEMAWFCNGATNQVFQRRSKAGVFDSGSPTAHTAKADVLAVIGSDLWRAKGYKVSVLTVDADPGMETSWGVEIPVGRPSYPVNEIVNLGGSPVVLKGDGVFKYNPAPSVAEFQNITPSLSPHPDNGKGGFTDGRGRIYYPTADGDLLVIGFGTQSQQRPVRLSGPDRETPFAKISSLATDQEFVYAAMAEGSRRTNKGQGLVVLTDDGGTFTDITTTATDDLFSTAASLATIGSADYIYVGADVRALGVWFGFLSGRTANYSNGTIIAQVQVSYSSSASAYTTVTGYANDSTLGFFRDGLITIQTPTGADISATWTLGDDPRGGGQAQKYWVRFRPQVDLIGATLRDVSIVPYRPPLDADLFPLSNYALAGCFPKILVGRWEGENIIWQDVWTLNAPRVDKMVATRMGYVGQTSERSLAALCGMMGLFFMPIGADGDPVRAVSPRLADYSSASPTLPAQSEHIIACSGNNFGLPDNIKHVDTLVVDFPYVQSDDAAWVYTWWDEDAERVEKYGPFSASSIIVEGVKGEGRTLYVALAFSDGSRDAVAPQLRSVTVPAGQWSYETEHFMLRRQDLQANPLR